MRHSKITIPVAPWDIPDAAGEEWDCAPLMVTSKPPRGKDPAPLPRSKPKAQTIPSVIPTPVNALINRTFRGVLNVSDLDYMAKAILQMCDENHELRERVKRLEDRMNGQ